MKFTPSKYNLDIFEEVKSGQNNIVIDAVPGSGKTTTIMESIKYVQPGLSVLVLAFNKSVKENAERKIKEEGLSAKVQTYHGLGLQAISRSFLCPSGKYPVVDEKKCYNIITQLLDQKYTDLRQDEANAYKPIIKRIVSYCKALNPPEINKKTVEYLIDKYNIYSDKVEPEIKRLTEMVAETLNQCKIQFKTIDYDDMLWYPIVYNLKMPYLYDRIFSDETQDTSPVQIELLLKTIKPNGKIVAVGDCNQAIYGFRGADSEAMPNVIKALNAKVMPLSITYRCPTKHVEKLKTFYHGLEAAPWAKEGSIIKLSKDKMSESVKNGDAIICRNTAPLIKLAFQLIRGGHKVVVKGRDIGDGLIAIINARKAKNMDDFLDRLKTWKENEISKLAKIDGNPETIIDKYDCLIVLSEECKDVACLKAKIAAIFDNTNAPIEFSTVHRFKGDERDRVFILCPELMPSSYAKTAEEFRQEKNCQYIAYSRSKDTIFEVN